MAWAHFYLTRKRKGIFMLYMMLKGPDVHTGKHFKKKKDNGVSIDWGHYGICCGVDEQCVVVGWNDYDKTGKKQTGDFVQIYHIEDEAKFDLNSLSIQNSIAALKGASLEKIQSSERDTQLTNVEASAASYMIDNPMEL